MNACSDDGAAQRRDDDDDDDDDGARSPSDDARVCCPACAQTHSCSCSIRSVM